MVPIDADIAAGRFRRIPVSSGDAASDATQWTPPSGHADIAPSRFARCENDGYLTLDAPWVVPALLRSVPIAGRMLEPAAGRGHLSRELQCVGLETVSSDIRAYDKPLVPDIGVNDIRTLTSLRGFAWVVTNLPYRELEELSLAAAQFLVGRVGRSAST